jgi:hypothetical protein
MAESSMDAVHYDATILIPSRLCPGTPDGWFDPGRRELVLYCTLPPTDNHLARTAPGGRRYPTERYRQWLALEHTRLRAVLGDWEPDRTTWWRVTLSLRLGSRPGDGQNRQKAIYDLLAGRCVAGRSIVDGKGLWDNDARIRMIEAEVVCIGHHQPGVTISALPTMEPERISRPPRRRRKHDAGTTREPGAPGAVGTLR